MSSGSRTSPWWRPWKGTQRSRAGLHYSGPLLEWIDANEPTFLDRLRALVEREQVEILGGAMYEPILVALPERDRHGQLRAHARGRGAAVRAGAHRRVAGRASVGAVAAARPGRRRLPLHAVGRQPPARRLGQRRCDVGHVHNRRPGPAADGIRDGEGPALPHSVAAGRGADRLPARRGDRGRERASA